MTGKSHWFPLVPTGSPGTGATGSRPHPLFLKEIGGAGTSVACRWRERGPVPKNGNQ